MAVGEPASLSSEFEKRNLDPDVEIVTTSGYGKNGALCVLQRSVKPQVGKLIKLSLEPHEVTPYCFVVFNT